MENKDLEKAIYMWFDMKYELYNKLDHDDSIYLYYEGQKYADIRIYKKYRYIYYNWNFKNEFFEVFPVELFDFRRFMVKWVENTLRLKGFIPDTCRDFGLHSLVIPQ